ncbi:hypothetical protein PP713_17950 [Mycobacterium sp. CSUR Q5927]|nr:hypothetical protein [Mycobacterium sp. CSUR Q5927]
MSTTTDTAAIQSAASVKNMRTTRKETAAAKKAPGKQTVHRPEVVNHDSGATADEVKATYRWTATGRGGKQNTRTSSHAVTHYVDVADPDGRTPAAKAGLVFRAFASREKADEFAARMNADGLDAVVAPVESCTRMEA